MSAKYNVAVKRYIVEHMMTATRIDESSDIERISRAAESIAATVSENIVKNVDPVWIITLTCVLGTLSPDEHFNYICEHIEATLDELKNDLDTLLEHSRNAIQKVNVMVH